MLLEGRVTSELFVGRKDELTTFKQLLSPESPVRLLNIHSNGDGGIGKTQLLLLMQKYCASMPEDVVFTKDLIDFYHTESHSKLGIMQQIAENLGVEYFTAFEELVTRYYQTEDVSEREGMLLKLEDVFKSDYSGLSKIMEARNKVTVLFFDTYEVIQTEIIAEGEKEVRTTEFSRWIETELFSRLLQNHNTRIVVSGRYPLQEIDHSQSYVEDINLQHLTPEEAIEFWKHCFHVKTDHELAEKIGVDSEEEMKTLYGLADGRPILLALFADWVNYERNPLAPEDLLHKIEQQTKKITPSVTEEQKQLFEKALIERIAYLIEPEDHAITYMAVAYHRMTPEMLHSLMDIPLDECQDILLKRMKPLSFIKYKQKDIVLLHDEMRRLVVQHWWNTQDVFREIRREIATKLVEYYDRKFLTAEGISEAERETYTSELLEYAFLAEPKDGLERFCNEFDIALEDGRYDYCDLLLREAESYHRKNPNDIPFPNFLEINLRRIRYNTYTDINYEKSMQVASAILERYQGHLEWLNSTIRGHFLLSKGTAELWLGKFEEAVNSLKKAKQIFYYVGEYNWLHQTNNWIGYAYYRRGQFTEAEKYLEQSRDGFYRSLVQQKGIKERERRQLLQGLQLALGNLAGVYSYTGRFEQAVRKAEITLNIVRHLPRNNLEIARTRTSVGHAALCAGHVIDARHHFAEAEKVLLDIRNRLITGRIETELGELQYRVNELAYLFEYYRAEEIEKIIEQYVSSEITEKARTLIKEAIKILGEEPAIKKELADAYYALGELYMVIPSKDHWEQAEDAFMKSLRWGEASKFLYRVVDTLESLITLYYFWNGTSELSGKTKKRNAQKMAQYQKELEGLNRAMYPDLSGKYEVTLGDIEFDRALELLYNESEEKLDTVITNLKEAFTHYVFAAELMESFNENHYYLILRIFYNRLNTLIDKAQETKKLFKVIERLDDLQSVWTGKSKKFRDIYRYFDLSVQSGDKRKYIEDFEDHIRNVLDKGNIGWAALLNECLIRAYRSLNSSDKVNDEYREQLILRLNSQSKLYRILGDEYQASQNIRTAMVELESIADSHLKEALEGYTNACEGTLKYRRGEYSKPLEFYLQDELDTARKKFDRQFPGARQEALQLLQIGERKLSVTITHWQESLTETSIGEEKSLLEERIRRHLRRLGEIRFRISELLMLNEQFDDSEDQKGALSYLKKVLEDSGSSGDTYYCDSAMQNYVNALYFSGRYDHPDYREGRMVYEKELEEKYQSQSAVVYPSIMGRLRITQGDILFSRCFRRKEELTGTYKYIPREGKTDKRILQNMLRYYVEACSFMIQTSDIFRFATVLRILQRRIGLIADRDALQVIQHSLRNIWTYQESLWDKADEELKTLDQFARIRRIMLEQ